MSRFPPPDAHVIGFDTGDMRGPEEKQRRKDVECKRRERSELLAWASSCTGVRLEEVSQVRYEAL